MKQFLLSFSSKLLFSLLEYLSLTLYYLKTGFLSPNQSVDIFSSLLLQSILIKGKITERWLVEGEGIFS